MPALVPHDERIKIKIEIKSLLCICEATGGLDPVGRDDIWQILVSDRQRMYKIFIREQGFQSAQCNLQSGQ
jgi:hypothetical protein